MPTISVPKSPLLSKTLWLNALTIAAAVLTALSGASNVIPPQFMPYIVGVLALVNFALRFVTTDPLNIGG